MNKHLSLTIECDTPVNLEKAITTVMYDFLLHIRNHPHIPFVRTLHEEGVEAFLEYNAAAATVKFNHEPVRVPTMDDDTIKLLIKD